MDTSCFSNIVGITKQPCTCIEESEASLSGLYLDDPSAGVIPLNQTIFSCNDATITDFLSGVITASTHEVLRMLRMEADMVMRKNYIDINTEIGWKNSWTAHKETSSDFHYIKIKPKFRRGLYLKITAISLLVQESLDPNDAELVIFDEYGDSVYSGESLLFEGTTLKMDRTWFIGYNRDLGITPKNTTAKQCCGYNPTFPTYVELGSGIATDWNSLAPAPATTFNRSIETYGICVDGQFICDGFDFICDLDFNTNFGALFANTIQQQARLNLGRWLFTNDRVTNYTLINAEALAQTLEYLQAKITENIKYLPKIYHYTDCYSCPGSYKGAILI